jgi:hypothetical protein
VSSRGWSCRKFLPIRLVRICWGGRAIFIEFQSFARIQVRQHTLFGNGISGGNGEIID